MRVIIPPTGNQFIAMLKDSSLVSVVGVWELMYLARTQGQTEFRHVEMMVTASMIYWLFSILLELIQARIERYYGRAHMSTEDSISEESAAEPAVADPRPLQMVSAAFKALDGIDLTVARGERLVICGPSGSGKSTLIRTINALEGFERGRNTTSTASA